MTPVCSQPNVRYLFTDVRDYIIIIIILNKYLQDALR